MENFHTKEKLVSLLFTQRLKESTINKSFPPNNNNKHTSSVNKHHNPIPTPLSHPRAALLSLNPKERKN